MADAAIEGPERRGALAVGSAASLVRLPGLSERPPVPERARRRRSALVRRGLVLADLVGLVLAFIVTVAIFGLSAGTASARPVYALVVFFLSLPAWILLAGFHGLYRYDEGRMGHSTVDDFVGVFHVVTVGAWLFFIGCWITDISDPRPGKLMCFWVLATLLVTAGRAVARTLCQRSPAYLQNTVIVGGGDVGQLVARKLSQHAEYGIRLLGLVDDLPKQRRLELDGVELLGPSKRLPEIVSELDIERVIIAFSKQSDARTAEIVQQLRALDLQIDIIPRLYELIGSRVDMHTVEGLPLVGLPSIRLSGSAMRVKRSIDLLASLVGLVLLSPIFAFIAWKVRRSSPGPVFFRQTRLGLNMREFSALKFRTMRVGAEDGKHRAYIERTMSSNASLGANGMYKLDRGDAVTPFGRWLRRTSLDELPQLINVLRGEMSLVGPRPCIPYETQYFKPHHFERFLVPAGITGLWQVTARARSSFGEALDMDVAYVRGWSLGLDLRLLCRTPVQLLRQGATA
jgi:exopolysaccharide biosynthesis polyprenyl glycosylphosphotransferase